jgi:ABC-type multidrug transport system ATPase subunit
VTALDEVSFSVVPGEVLGVIGPNGAGKTTLFECIAGLLSPDRGTVFGRENLFYLPDGIIPWDRQPVGWVLRFFDGIAGGDPGSRARIVDELALGRLAGRPVGGLSHGERKRLLLGLALLTPRPVLLLDEPFDGLDLRQGREAATGLRRVAERGRTLVLSIHQIAEAERVCDRVVLLVDGRVRRIGTVAELRQQAGMTDGTLEDVFLALT